MIIEFDGFSVRRSSTTKFSKRWDGLSCRNISLVKWREKSARPGRCKILDDSRPFF